MDASKKHVTILYGPYSSCGVVAHRTERLEGLQSELMSLVMSKLRNNNIY